MPRRAHIPSRQKGKCLCEQEYAAFAEGQVGIASIDDEEEARMSAKGAVIEVLVATLFWQLIRSSLRAGAKSSPDHAPSGP